MARVAAIVLVLCGGCRQAPTFYSGCQSTSPSCPAGFHCSLGGFCTRYCAIDDDCTREFGDGTYCAATRDCWITCAGDAGFGCPSGTTCELGACLAASDAGALGDP